MTAAGHSGDGTRGSGLSLPARQWYGEPFPDSTAPTSRIERRMRLANLQSPLHLGLALSGGMARSVAHVGVIKALEEEGLTPDYIAGTSGGALVGSLYAAGTPVSRMEEIATKVRWRDLAGLSIPRIGLVSSEGIARFMRRHIGECTFADVAIPIRIIATDLLNGEKVILANGSVAEAVRASCCVPQLYSPVELDGRLLVDGGLVEYMPVQTVRDMGADFVIGVNASSRAAPRSKPRNMVQVGFLVGGVVAQWNARHSEKITDVVIKPDVSRIGSFDLDAGPQLVELGYNATRAAMPEIRAKMEKHGTWLFRLRRYGMRFLPKTLPNA
jgi:NTE family protein